MLARVKLVVKVVTLQQRVQLLLRERRILRAKVADLSATLTHVQHENRLLHQEHMVLASQHRKL